MNDRRTCLYPSEYDGKRCFGLATWAVCRMTTDFQGPDKWVFVCDRHAAEWRKRIPYCYMENLATGEPYPGQRLESDYDRRHAMTDDQRFSAQSREAVSTHSERTA